MFKNMIVVTLPACWASALINLDYSGMDERSQAELNNFLANHDPCLSFADCLSVGDEYIGRFDNLRCDVADYTFEVCA